MASPQDTNNALCGAANFRVSQILIGFTGKSAHMYSFSEFQNCYRNGSGSAVAATKDDAKVDLTYRVRKILAELETEDRGRLKKENAPVPKLFVRERNNLFKSTFVILD